LQQADRARLAVYHRAAEQYLIEFRRSLIDSLPLPDAHEAACQLAAALLPPQPLENGSERGPSE